MEEVLSRAGVEGAKGECEPPLTSWLPRLCRWASGNSGSFAFFFGNRKKLFVLRWVFRVGGGVFPKACIRGAGLSSDLEDSESLLPGSGNGGG